ncbi:hypothetical protein LOD99_10566 [Oopsacas minuta]|uniref:Uncharacterized protein n=1 Tax=Oopsacas minuta TaxID=111878 RepID=A0AAV7KFI7_9METZ|nr:hypothetical protein LOD99_10566 [Oopsacas minuta]
MYETSQAVILSNRDNHQEAFNIIDITNVSGRKKNCCSILCKKIIVTVLTIFVVVTIWTSLIAAGGTIFLLDQQIEPSKISSDSNFNMTLTNSSNDLPIVYIFLSQLVNNDSQIYKLYEIYLNDLNNRKFKFSMNNCNETNCTNEGSIIAYLAPILLTTPNLVVSEEYLLFDFSNVSFSNEDRFYRSNVSILNITTTGMIDKDIKLERILFGVNVQCPEGYEFNSKHRFCAPADFISHHWHPSGKVGRFAMRIGNACIAIIGFISSILSLTTLLLKTFFVDKNTLAARQTKLGKFFEALLAPSILFLYLFASFCVVLLVIFDLPDPSVTYQKQYNTQSDLILLNVYGALFHFGIFAFYFWVNFTLLNLLLTIMYPLQLKANNKIRIGIIVTELMISIIIPILLVIGSLALRDGRPYMSIYIWLIVSDSDNIDESLPSLILYFIPLFAYCLGILTLTPLIVARIKWDFIRSEKLKINGTKLTGLQYRIMLYAIIMFILWAALLIGLILYITIYQSNLFAVYFDEFGCLTSQRPSSIYRNDRLEEYDTLLDAFRSLFGTNDVINQYIHQCYVVDKTNTTHPGWLFIAEAFLIRILIICIFIVTLPSKSNYYVWKNFFLKLSVCCKKLINK